MRSFDSLEVMYDLRCYGDGGGDSENPEEDLVRLCPFFRHNENLVGDDVAYEVRHYKYTVPNTAEPSVFHSRFDIANPHSEETGYDHREYELKENR